MVNVNATQVATVAQHYIPRFYLKGFTDREGVLWVYEKFKAPRASKPKEEAHRPDYYTHADAGERDETAENLLKGIESRVALPIRKLANPHYVPTREGMADLTFFVAVMFARVPSWREFLDRLFGETMKTKSMELARDKDKFAEMIQQAEQAGAVRATDCERLRGFILSGDYEIRQESVGFNLGTMFKSALTIAEMLEEFRMEALYAPAGTFFLTSDSPVFTLRQEGKHAALGGGFGWPNTAVYFPLNKRSCLRLKRGLTPRGRPIDVDYVQRINRVTMAFANRFLYSNEGYRRTARLFDEYGCKIKPGRDAFMSEPPSDYRDL